MARTAAESVALSDDDITDLVNDATSDLTEPASAPGEEGEDELTLTSETNTSDLDEPEETEEGLEEEEEPGTEIPEGAPAPAGTKPGEPPAVGAPTADKPFQFKASGAQITFAGATETGTGETRFSKEATVQLRQVLASQVEYQKQLKDVRRTSQAKIKSLETDRSDKDIEADLVIGLFQNIRKMTPEERWKWANELDEKAPALEVQIEKAKLKRDRDALEREKKGPELSPEEQAEVYTSAWRGEVDTTFERLLALPESKVLTDADKQLLRQKWHQRGGRLVSREGDQVIFDDTEIVEDFAERIELRKEAGGLASAASRNAARNADRTGTKIPPHVKGGKPPAPAPPVQKDFRGKRKKFTKEFMEGRLDSQ